MALSFPRSVFMEWFLGGLGWTDVTSYVRQTSPVTITRGRANEQGKVAPSKLTCVMEDETGDMNPGNPRGLFFGLLGRNTPLRFGLLLARDTFTRSVTDGLGSTDTGEVWTLDGTAANFDVGGSTATIAIAAASTTRHAYLASLASLVDYEVTVDVTVPYPNGVNNFGGVVFRGSTVADAWRLSITVDSTGAVNLNIADGAGTLMGSIYEVDTVSAGTYRVRALVEDSTVRGKAWPVAEPEPADWQVTHTATTGLNPSGWPGIRARTGSGASNVTFTYDNFTVRIIRFAGELADLKPRWDESHNIKWANLEASGILRRMQQGNAPLLSALRRGMLRSTTPPFGYWPMEDGKDATTFAPAVGTTSIGDTPLAISFGDPKSATNDDFACSDLLPTLNGALLALEVPDYDNPNSALQVRFLLSIPTSGETPDGGVLCRLYTSGTVAIWDLVYYTASGGTIGLNAYNQVGTQILNDISLDGNNGRPERVYLNLEQNGANVDWEYDVGPVPTDIDTGFVFGVSGTLTSQTFGKVFLMSLGSADGFKSTSLGHLSLHNEITPVLDLRNELGAYVGERALDRFTRLTAEEGISSAYLSDGALTAKMGPQRVRKLVDLLTECAAADRAELYESRASGALVLRTGSTLRNQTAAVTLDYAGGHVSPPFEPGADDQGTRNDITVKRTNGSSYRAVQTSGPLNVQDPLTSGDPEAVGRYDTSVEVNVHSDTQLPDIAGALLRQGTVQEVRFPKVKVDMAATNVDGDIDIEAAVMAADIDDRVVIENLSAANLFDPVDQIARGYTERFTDEQSHEIVFNASPYSPFRVFVLGTSRLQAGTSTLSAGIDDNDLSWQVATPTGALWTTAGADFPMNIVIGGEEIILSGISGASSPQTFTASQRSVNGVIKSHLAGAAVTVAHPDYLG